MFSASSCKKSCKTCDYGTQCNPTSGYCFCPNGLEGDSCHTYSFTKYVTRNYIVSDPCSGYGSNYSAYIQVDQNSINLNRLIIYNLFGTQVEADILSDASKQGVNLSIPDQNLGAFQVSGSGFYQNTSGYARITLNLEYLSGGQSSNCTVIMTQQ